MTYSLRQKVGALVFDLPRFVRSMQPWRRDAWLKMCNRDERLTFEESGRGACCDWQLTSDLHIAKVFPSLGRLLMKRALSDCGIALGGEPEQKGGSIEVSFIIGHRGVQRLPHLLLTLQSIAAQRSASFECIVVEQSAISEVKQQLPSWIRYVHTPLPYGEMPYCRAWAFNVGARLAQGRLLVLHDNDMLVPRDYAAQLLARAKEGHEVINLKRFIFFLSRDHSERLLRTKELLFDEAPESIMQNAEGGGSLAITRDAYFAVGGFDESFVGWGGEDNEFWERAKTRRLWPYGYLPLVHLWHPAQPEKLDDRRSTATLLEARSAISPIERIAELTSRDFGNLQSAPANLAPVELCVE